MTMTSHDAVDVTSTPPLSHHDGMALFAAELARHLDLMRSLHPEDWHAQTECPDWDVRRMYLHVLGAGEGGASVRELLHQLLAARRYQKKHGGPQEAALSAVQVADRQALDPDALVTRFETMAPACVRGRTRLPALIRAVKTGIDGPVVEKWSIGYLVDTIYLRDAWMHRIDVARATGATLVLTADHDGRIVADVVAEWARRHRRPFRLTLTGPAGGAFTGHGAALDADSRTMDAVEFCRTLSGRTSGTGLLSTVVPF